MSDICICICICIYIYPTYIYVYIYIYIRGTSHNVRSEWHTLSDLFVTSQAWLDVILSDSH